MSLNLEHKVRITSHVDQAEPISDWKPQREGKVWQSNIYRVPESTVTTARSPDVPSQLGFLRQRYTRPA